MAPNLLKWPTAPRGRPKPLNQGPFPHDRRPFLQQGLRSAGGLKLLKWGLSGEGSSLLKRKVPPTPYVYYPPVTVTVKTRDSDFRCPKTKGHCVHSDAKRFLVLRPHPPTAKCRQPKIPKSSTSSSKPLLVRSESSQCPGVPSRCLYAPRA
eukprot:scaffold127350_cov48-Phaeocystis_antarctica.AAC.3